MKRQRGKKSGEEMEGEKEKEEEDITAWAGKGQMKEGAREMMQESDVTSAGSLGTNVPSAPKKPNEGKLKKLLIIFILMELWIMQNFNKLMKSCIIHMVTTVFP